MPNHVTNKIKATPKIINSCLNSDGNFDFLLIIEKPKKLKSTDDGGVYINAENAAKNLFGEDTFHNALNKSIVDHDDVFNQFIMMVTNKKETGFYHDMDFARSEWGTKWNAYEQDISKVKDGEIRFNTAWSHPEKVINALSKKFPDEEIYIEYADEDIGSNCGSYSVKNGVRSDENIAPNWSKQSEDEKRKWTEFAFKLTNPDSDPKEFGYNEYWEYIGD